MFREQRRQHGARLLGQRISLFVGLGTLCVTPGAAG